MKAIKQSQVNALGIEELEGIDRICSEFEEQFRTGSIPAIESFLPAELGTFRSELLVELLKLDIDYRNRAEIAIDRQDYIARFPLDVPEIDLAFDHPDGPEIGRDVRLDEPLDFKMRYQLLRFHARGGLGEIYVARDAGLDREVAIKFPRNRSPGSTDQLRMAQEAQITGRLKHPGIVPVYAVDHGGGGSICYVMQFIHGETLKAAIERFHVEHQGVADKFRTWEFRRLLQRFVALCSTVAYAHGEGVIHRDIKPSNVMIGDFGETFLLDWGIAKVIPSESDSVKNHESAWVDPNPVAMSHPRQSHPAATAETPGELSVPTRPTGDGNAGGQTAAGQPMGTPEFASPEQVLGQIEAHGPRSDVYSLGATLYYLLTARQTVDAEDLSNLKTAAAIRRIQQPRDYDKRMPVELNAVCQRAMSYEIADRYSTATDLADDIERYLADELVSVLKPALLSRFGRWVRHRPKRASAIVAGLVVALLAMICGGWLLNKKADQLAGLVQIQEDTNRELSAAKRSAEERAEDTIAALHTLSDNVVQQWFSKQSSFSAMEKEFLNDLLQQYEDVADAFPDDHRSLELRAQGFYNAAQIHKLLGNSDQALDATDAVIEVLTPVAHNLSENIWMLLGTAHADRGVLMFERGKYEAGFLEMDRGVDFFRQLGEQFPDSPRYRKLLLKAQNQIGTAKLSHGEAEQAAPIFHSLVESTRKITSANPEDLDSLDMYVKYLGNLGIAQSKLGDFEAADAAFLEADVIYSQFEQQGVLYADAHRAAANVTNLITRGRLAYSQDNLELADSIYEQAIADCHRLIAAFPTLVKAHHLMTGCRYGAALVRRDRKEYDRAIEESQLAVDSANKCIELNPRAVVYHETRALAQLTLAQIQTLAGSFDKSESEFELALQFARERYELSPTAAQRIKVAHVLGDLAVLQNRRKDNESAIASLQEMIAILESEEIVDSDPKTVQTLEKSRSLLEKYQSQ